METELVTMIKLRVDTKNESNELPKNKALPMIALNIVFRKSS